MEQNEMVTKLHEKAKISIAEARDALERADWDMLEALVILEKEGKIAPLTASMTTIENKSAYEEVTATASPRGRERKFNTTASSFFDKLSELLKKSLTHSFIIEREGREILSLPVLIMLIVAASMFYFVIVSLVIGLFLDCRYSIQNKNETGNNKTE